MADITPITREEFYLAKAGGQDVPVPSAVTREEYYLEKLTNDNVAVPTPVTRREKFLYFACGGEIDLPSEEKMTRLERLIAKAGGMDVSTPTAVTRLEKLWANVEGGGWKTITGVLPLTFTAKGGTAADWVISGNAQGVGERTQNLVEGKIANTNINAGGQIISNSGYNTWVAPIEQGVTYTFTTDGAVYAEYTGYPVLGSVAYNNTRVIATTTFTATIDGYIAFRTSINYATAMCVVGSTAPETYIPYGYQIPLAVSQQGQPDKTVDIYIGDSPLTEGETVSKTSTGVDIELFEGENTVSTTLYNKPTMEIKYL